MKHTQIKTTDPDLTLRELSLQDARPYFTLLEQNREHLSQFGTMTEARYASVKEVAESVVNPKPKKRRFGVWYKDNLVGLVSLMNKGRDKCEIGGWIGANYTQRGYGANALRALAKYAKLQKYTTITATTHPDNIPSQNMLKKIGFTRSYRRLKRHYFRLKT